MDNETTPPENIAPSSDAPAAEPDLSAGFWLRAGAYMIDGILIAIVSIVMDRVLPETVSVIARIVLSAGYLTIMPMKAQGQTLGKMAAGIAIVRNDDSPLTYGRLFARWLGYLLSALSLCLGFVCAAFTKRKRALHDYLAGTRVVRVQEIRSVRKFAVILTGLLFPLLIALGIAAAVTDPRFTGSQRQADEDAAKTHLAELRSALSIYYGDAKNFPAGLEPLAPKYIPEIVPAGVSAHPDVAGVETYGAEVCSGSKEPGKELLAAQLHDTGKWGYVVAPNAPCAGRVFIDCTHTDSRGSAWYTY